MLATPDLIDLKLYLLLRLEILIVKVFLTGASGFVGSRLAATLLHTDNVSLTLASRVPISVAGSVNFVVPGISGATEWVDGLSSHQVVIHTAAHAHKSQHDKDNALEYYRSVNVDGTVNLAEQAAMAGVQRFIFISSIGVNGNLSYRPLTEEDGPNPVSLYAHSKMEAEIGLREVAKQTGMEIVIIRPPLVYGPKAPGNFHRLTRLVASGIPLPFGAVRNKRSLIAVDNLVDLIITCLDHPNAANELFLVGDGIDISTTELIQKMAEAMGQQTRLISVSEGLLKLGAGVVGKSVAMSQLLESLQVDISKVKQVLGWVPPVSIDEGLRLCFDPQEV